MHEIINSIGYIGGSVLAWNLNMVLLACKMQELLFEDLCVLLCLVKFVGLEHFLVLDWHLSVRLHGLADDFATLHSAFNHFIVRTIHNSTSISCSHLCCKWWIGFIQRNVGKESQTYNLCIILDRLFQFPGWWIVVALSELFLQQNALYCFMWYFNWHINSWLNCSDN
jgi:hypothetical protein